MKMFGKELAAPEAEVVVLPRSGASEDLVFKIQVVLNRDSFEEVYPRPEPGYITMAGEDTKPDLEDEKYLEKLDERVGAELQWLFLKSLEATDGLAWDTVDITKPSTWDKWPEEMSQAGVPEAHQTYLYNRSMEINGFSTSAIEKATKAFLAGQGVRLDLS